MPHPCMAHPSITHPYTILEVPRGVLEFVVGDRVATDEIVVLYCSNGYRAALAAQTMLDLG